MRLPTWWHCSGGQCRLGKAALAVNTVCPGLSKGQAWVKGSVGFVSWNPWVRGHGMLSREVQRWPGAWVRFCSPLTVGLWAGQQHPSLSPSLPLCQGGSRMAPTSRDSCNGSTARCRSVCGRMPGLAGAGVGPVLLYRPGDQGSEDTGPSWPPRASVPGLGLHGMDGRTGVYREKQLWE